MYKEKLIEKLDNREAVIGIIGLGYVGLPLAILNASLGYKVLGVENNPERAEKVNLGISYIVDVPSELLRDYVSRGFIRASTTFEEVPQMDIILIAVPTPLTANLAPELKYVRHVTYEISKRLRPGQLVILESTTYPGTTEEVILPQLESSGLKPDEEFFLAHSPERVDPGNKRYNTGNTSKVVGAIGPNSLEVATAYYSRLVSEVVTVSSPKVAEMCKIFENTFRAVNIALVNELAMLCDKMGINVWEVLEAAFTKPFGIMRFYPGPGVGGHCIPVDPHYLEWKAKEYNFDTRFIALASEINRRMPEFVLNKIFRLLNSQGIAPSKAKLLIIGVTYKPDVPDTRNSPAIQLLELLKAWKVKVDYHDPYIDVLKLEGEELHSVELNPDMLRQYDLVVIVTAHTKINWKLLVEHSKCVLDTRNATKFLGRRDNVTLL